MPRQPAKYVKSTLVSGDDGRLFLRVSNGTPADLSGVRVQVALRWAAAGDESFTVDFPSIPAGQAVDREIPLREEALVAGEATTIAASTR